MNAEVVIAARPAYVLIVDDESDNREILCMMLAPEGFVLRTADDGQEALTMIADRVPDLILLDAMMPGLSGYDVAASVKSDARTRNVPIMIVTAMDGQEARRLGRAVGAEDFLSKPVNRSELRARVKRLLGGEP